MTTDRGPKRACLDVDLPSGRVRLSAQAKGAGMISPDFATMFCFVQTDAALALETVDLLTGVCVKRSFDRISVDGQLSTSDTVFVMANGASGVAVEPESPDELALRRGVRRAAAPARVRDRGRRRGGPPRRPRRRPRRARAGRPGGPRGRRIAAREDPAPRRGPQLRAHPPVRRARRSRRPARRSWSTWRSRAARSSPAARSSRSTTRSGARSRRRSGATRSSTSSTCPATTGRPRSSSRTSRTST